MSYSSKLRIEIPSFLYDVACNIARALDPDVGGVDSFGPRLQGDPPAQLLNYFTETPCTSEFAEQVINMLKYPEVLHSVVSADYSARWQEYDSPTLQDCIDFCMQAQVTNITDDINLQSSTNLYGKLQ